MNLFDFIALGDLHTISSGDLQYLNKDLSEMSIFEVPAEHKAKFIDYLLSVLNMGSVEPSLIPKLEQLLGDLQKDS